MSAGNLTVASDSRGQGRMMRHLTTIPPHRQMRPHVISMHRPRIFPSITRATSTPPAIRPGLALGFRLLFLGLGCLALATFGRATTVNPPEFPQLVNESDYIVRAVVKAVTAELRTMPSGKRMPFSRVELEVKQVIAGKPPAPLVLEVLGGMVGGRELAIAGVPKFAVGEEEIFFVQGNGKQVYPLVRMAHGRYPIVKEAATGREYMVRKDGAPLRSVSEVSRPVHLDGGKVTPAATATVQAAAQALTPDEFVLKIRANITQPRLLEK